MLASVYYVMHILKGSIMLNRKITSVLLAVLLLVLGSAAYALPPRVSWIPAELMPSSTAPGESATYTVTLKHTGLLPIPATNQLKVVAEGAIAPFVAITQPSFPPVFKRGNQVTFSVTVSVPLATPMSVTSGTLVLQRILPNGKVKEVWRADKLPVELTFSSIPLPPDPGEDGKATLEGIDVGGGPTGEPNGVRDDIDRYIGFTYPNSAKVREALSQHARALTPFLRDASDKDKTRENNVDENKGYDCLVHVMNNNIDLAEQADDALLIEFLNTQERSRTYNKADGQLGGITSPSGPILSSEFEAHRKATCSFNPDSLPN